ncbi:hypothetical protein GCWU000341_00320 [Oribacterium sp. oral taxon 078 str. F0262]|nr:hypothetical protein GCWU000341_00320 [Oribacterium sp. oral taxon 078 str. F0262]
MSLETLAIEIPPFLIPEELRNAGSLLLKLITIRILSAPPRFPTRDFGR